MTGSHRVPGPCGHSPRNRTRSGDDKNVMPATLRRFRREPPFCGTARFWRVPGSDMDVAIEAKKRSQKNPFHCRPLVVEKDPFDRGRLRKVTTPDLPLPTEGEGWGEGE